MFSWNNSFGKSKVAFFLLREQRGFFPQYLCTYNQFGLLGGIHLPKWWILEGCIIRGVTFLTEFMLIRETEKGLFWEDYVVEFRRNSVILMDVNWMHCQTIKLSLLSPMLWLIMCKLLYFTKWQVCMCVLLLDTAKSHVEVWTQVKN